MVSTIKILISGRVQGVYFRRFAKNKAVALGVKGTVRNREDGRVEIVAQAEKEVLQAFIQWCHKGPITAKVGHVEITEIQDFEKKFDSFEIVWLILKLFQRLFPLTDDRRSYAIAKYIRRAGYLAPVDCELLL